MIKGTIPMDLKRVRNAWKEFESVPFETKSKTTTLELAFLRLESHSMDYLLDQATAWKQQQESSDSNASRQIVTCIRLRNCLFQNENTMQRFLEFLYIVGQDQIEEVYIDQEIYPMCQECWTCLLHGLQDFSSLQRLVLLHADLQDPMAVSLLKRLLEQDHCFITDVCFDSCEMEDTDCFRALVDGLAQHGTGLKRIQISHCGGVGRNEIEQLIQGVLSSPTKYSLQSLQLDHLSDLTTADCLTSLTLLLHQVKSLESFQFSHCSQDVFDGLVPQDDRFANFVEALAQASTLKTLNLSQCHLSQAMIVPLLQAMKDSKVESLNITEEEVFEDDAALMSALQLANLHSLCMHTNMPLSCDALSALHKNTPLLNAQLSTSKQQDDNFSPVQVILDRNSHLQRAEALLALPPRKQTDTSLPLFMERLDSCPSALFWFVSTHEMDWSKTRTPETLSQ